MFDAGTNDRYNKLKDSVGKYYYCWNEKNERQHTHTQFARIDLYRDKQPAFSLSDSTVWYTQQKFQFIVIEYYIHFIPLSTRLVWYFWFGSKRVNIVYVCVYELQQIGDLQYEQYGDAGFWSSRALLIFRTINVFAHISQHSLWPYCLDLLFLFYDWRLKS